VRAVYFVAWIVATALPWSVALTASAQSSVAPEIYRAWIDDANGRPCETQLLGYFPGAANFAYPAGALASGVSGDVLLTFYTEYESDRISITNARIFASEPGEVFDEAALSAATQFRFPPGMRNCQGVRAVLQFRILNGDVEGAAIGYVTPAEAMPPLDAEAARALQEGTLSTHCGIEGGAINPDQLGEALFALYPRRAQGRDQHGYAVVQFSIAPDGAVVRPVALEEIPAGWEFGAAAVQAISVARYPVRESACENAATLIRFVLQ